MRSFPRRPARILAALWIAGCTATPGREPPPPPEPAPRPTASEIQPQLGVAVDAAIVVSDAAVEADAGPAMVTADRAEEVLFGEPARGSSRSEECPTSAARDDRVRCLTKLRYESDPAAAKVAIDLFDRTGDIIGTHPDITIDGGYRGRIHLLPDLALGAERRHLAWIAAATSDFDAFFAGVEGVAKQALPYRARSLAFRVFRSEHRTTPSAYAEGWSVSYNVRGSLNTSADAVRETLFHEIFHLNDAAHGGWSEKALTPIFDSVVARCGSDTRCLRPYAPSSTVVRGGTYYAFQPGNGVVEYAAELSLRYYRETRAALAKRRFETASFKCGPDENARAWALIVREFFGGVDLSAPC